MKVIAKTLLMIIFMTSSAVGYAAQRELKVDTTVSVLRWTGKKVTGTHHGSVRLLDGKIQLDGDEIVGGSFRVDMSSIVVEDIKDPKYNRKLTDHLKSNDFFDATDFPNSNFEILSAKKLSTPGSGGENYEVLGKLSIVGVTHEISFPAKIEIGQESASATAKVEVDRTKYNIRYGSGKFFESLGDKLIYDLFEVEIALVAK